VGPKSHAISFFLRIGKKSKELNLFVKNGHKPPSDIPSSRSQSHTAA
jgi:hypothetical protein